MHSVTFQREDPKSRPGYVIRWVADTVLLGSLGGFVVLGIWLVDVIANDLASILFVASTGPAFLSASLHTTWRALARVRPTRPGLRQAVFSMLGIVWFALGVTIGVADAINTSAP